LSLLILAEDRKPRYDTRTRQLSIPLCGLLAGHIPNDRSSFPVVSGSSSIFCTSYDKHVHEKYRLRMNSHRVFKGKERKSIYIASFCIKVHTKRSGMGHTILPANNTMPAFPSWRSPDVTTTATEAADIQLQLTTHLSTPKG